MELDYQYNHTVVSRLIMYGFPFLLLSFSSWLFLVLKYDLITFIIFVVITGLIFLWLMSIKNLQKNEYDNLINSIYNEISMNRNKNRSKPANME